MPPLLSAALSLTPAAVRHRASGFAGVATGVALEVCVGLRWLTLALLRTPPAQRCGCAAGAGRMHERTRSPSYLFAGSTGNRPARPVN
eukprot:4451301-Pyramimonas_sp.AAC.1